KGKPDPMPYQVALEHLGVSSKSAVAFEDSPSGIRSAVSAGILTVGIATTHDPQALIKVGATLAIHNFADPKLAELKRKSRANESIVLAEQASHVEV
ncbi:MAG: HAD-IA family hydrolase, partial [Coleofasciculus sp. Co-bin14]|nr:HAD-IA family hydrolase [Coleofasciculus sp. Co-bin14]